MLIIVDFCFFNPISGSSFVILDTEIINLLAIKHRTASKRQQGSTEEYLQLDNVRQNMAVQTVNNEVIIKSVTFLQKTQQYSRDRPSYITHQ